MALVFKDRVADTSSTTGTGTFTLANSPPIGYRAFSAHTTGDTIQYCISNASGSEWEVGEGVWTSSGTTLSRVTVFASSNSNALVSFSAGTKTVIEVFTATSASKVTHMLDKIRVRNATGGNSAASAWGKIPFDTVEYDTASLWNSTNKYVVPTRAGYYSVSVACRITSGTDTAVSVRVSGGTTYNIVGSNPSSLSICGSTIVYCNGTTDYIEAYTFTAASRTFDTTVGFQYMSVFGPL